ncbi:hypothetical protein [Leptotrichia massiliensis]|uniref:hypothetical protein n=1 Tax=Leptotrichia massiliensis TaxID=1852388 RepID=UPI0028D569AB|nr:hypothetical protein [Leptotrichia massiliensis]
MKNSYTLKYNLKENDEKIYQIKSKVLYSNLMMNVKKDLKFKMEFKYLGKDKFDSYIVKNKKFNIKNFLNENEMGKVIFEIDNAFSDVSYCINQNGEIIEIKNLNELKNNFYEVKKKIQKMELLNPSEVQTFLDTTTKVLNSPTVIRDYFQNFSTNNIFYGGLYNETYINNITKKKKIKIPNFIIFLDLPLKLEIGVEKIDFFNDEIKLNVNGILDEIKLNKRAIEEILKSSFPEENIRILKYEVTYIQKINFYISTGFVKSCEQIIEIIIFNKDSDREIFRNRQEIIINDEKGE